MPGGGPGGQEQSPAQPEGSAAATEAPVSPAALSAYPAAASLPTQEGPAGIRWDFNSAPGCCCRPATGASGSPISGFVFTWAGDGHGGTLVTEAAAPAAAAQSVDWFGAAPAARHGVSPSLADSGAAPGHAPASLALVSGGLFGHG